MPPRKMHCDVRGCDQRSKNVDINTLAFHRFPLEVKDAEEWSHFTGSEYAINEFERFGPIGVRKFWMCSQHFEPTCYKVPGMKYTLKHGAKPTLNGPSEVSAASAEALTTKVLNTNSVGNATPESSSGIIASKVHGAAVVTKPTEKARKRKSGHGDPFYSFLLDDEGNSTNLRRPHAPLCACKICRNDGAAKTMEKNSAPTKATQTTDIGPQPDASPVPYGASKDSCRLCFSTGLLEPLFSGMIVVRDEMLDKIYVCTGILITPRPKASMFICTPCAQLINSFYAYRQQVCSNNRALLKNKIQTKSYHVTRKLVQIPPLSERKPIEKYTVKQVPSIAGLIPVLDTVPIRNAGPTLKPKMPMVVQPEVTVATPIKDEQEDPLEGCDETTQVVSVLGKDKLEPPDLPQPLDLEVVESHEDLPEQDRWECWHCDNSFLFQFECAKHLLQVHEEDVSSIAKRLLLDELNTNMLQMMSLNQKK